MAVAGALYASGPLYRAFSATPSTRKQSVKGVSFNFLYRPAAGPLSVKHLKAKISFKSQSAMGCVASSNLSTSRGILLPRALNPSMDTGFTESRESGREDFDYSALLPRVWEMSPLEISRWAIKPVLVLWVLKKLILALSNPLTYVYASWSLILWPWPTAVIWGIHSLFTVYRLRRGEDVKIWEQLLMLGGALTWLLVVPVAHVNGYIEGWPVAFFISYFLFFLTNFHIRYSVYEDVTPSVFENNKWNPRPSKLGQVSFVGSVIVGHVLAAFEGLRLPVIQGGWNNVFPCVLLFWALAWQYNATFYLAKYSRKLVEPVAVVMFGPYRWVRHPIYTSYMLLFASYCCAFQAYRSLFIILLACVLYYGKKAQLEEEVLLERFKDIYGQYREKVKHKFFPFVY